MLVVPTLGQKISALQVSWIKDIRCGGETAGMIREVAEKIKAAGKEDVMVGIVGFNGLPYQDFDCLKKRITSCRFYRREQIS